MLNNIGHFPMEEAVDNVADRLIGFLYLKFFMYIEFLARSVR